MIILGYSEIILLVVSFLLPTLLIFFICKIYSRRLLLCLLPLFLSWLGFLIAIAIFFVTKKSADS